MKTNTHLIPPMGLTIGLCTYNRAPLLRRMLDSIARQTCQDFTLIVLDDCSKDETEDVCRSLPGRSSRYVRNPRNLGFNANYNQALQLAETSHVLLTHDDDYMDPGFIEYLIEGVRRHPEAIMVTTNVRTVAENGSTINANALRLDGDVVFGVGEFGSACLWRGMGLYCPTFCFNRVLCRKHGVAFQAVGPGSDLLISLTANLSGPIAVLSEAHFNVCEHARQDHMLLHNYLSADFIFHRAAHALITGSPTYRHLQTTVEFQLMYTFGKLLAANLLQHRTATTTETPVEIFRRVVATLEPGQRATVLSSARNRVAALLFECADLVEKTKVENAEWWVRSFPFVSTERRKLHLLNLHYLDRLEGLLRRQPRLRDAPVPAFFCDRVVLIWGMSYTGIVIAETLRRARVTVAGFVDRDSRLHGAHYREWSCRSWPEVARTLPDSSPEVLLISSSEGTQEIEIMWSVFKQSGTAAPCLVRSWRAIVDCLEACF